MSLQQADDGSLLGPVVWPAAQLLKGALLSPFISQRIAGCTGTRVRMAVAELNDDYSRGNAHALLRAVLDHIRHRRHASKNLGEQNLAGARRHTLRTVACSP